LPDDYRLELLAMLAEDRKCELESMYIFGLEFIVRFLELKMLTKDFI
jgi:hypothetical protein